MICLSQKNSFAFKLTATSLTRECFLEIVQRLGNRTVFDFFLRKHHYVNWVIIKQLKLTIKNLSKNFDS